MAGENDPSSQNPASHVTYEDGIMELFDQVSRLMLPVSDWLEQDTIAISEASLTRKSATYQVTIQDMTTALLDTGTNISVLLKKFFSVISTNTSTVKNRHT